MVWRRRHYRVRRAERPGTFFFSVLDNGVISNEFWRRARAVRLLLQPLHALFLGSQAAVLGKQIQTSLLL